MNGDNRPDKTPQIEHTGLSDKETFVLSKTDRHLERLAEIAAFAYDHSKFYKVKYSQAGVDIRRANLPYDVPIVTPQELVAAPERFRSDVPWYRVVAGSGTTGSPKLTFRTDADFKQSIRNEQRLQKWAGVDAHDVLAIAQAYDLWASGELIQRAAQRIGAKIVPIGSIPDKIAFSLLAKTGVTVLDTTPSRLERMLVYAEDTPAARQPPLRIVMVSGEPLQPGIRDRVNQLWQAQVFNQYGTEETDALAGTQVPKGMLTLLTDEFLFELNNPKVDPITGEKCGQLLVSSLYHRGTPLVRYLLDDIICLSPDHPESIIVKGRVSECFYLYDAVKLHAYQVQAVIDTAGMGGLQWQCRLERDHQGIDLIHFLFLERYGTIVPPAHLEEVLNVCTNEVAVLVNQEQLRIRVEKVAELKPETRRGKRRRFIDMRSTWKE